MVEPSQHHSDILSSLNPKDFNDISKLWWIYCISLIILPYVRIFQISYFLKLILTPKNLGPKPSLQTLRPKVACEARAFNELRIYHTNPSRFNWGLENVQFRKTHFKDLEIVGKIFLTSYKN